MPVVVYSKPISNIEDDDELSEYVEEINGERMFERLIIVKYTETIGLITKKQNDTYRIYWDLKTGEYQQLLEGIKLNRNAVLAYVIGVLNGMDLAKRLG